jgi:hypothetical protein
LALGSATAITTTIKLRHSFLPVPPQPKIVQDVRLDKQEEASELAELVHRNPSIKSLNCEAFRITDRDLKPLTQTWRLRDLNISETGVTDAGMVYLQNLPLLALELAEVELTDKGLERVSQVSSLLRLDLEGTKVTDGGIAKLRRLAHLVTLRLDATRVTDAGLTPLVGLPALENLMVGQTSITDKGLAEIAKMRNLIYLNVHGTRVSHEGIKHLVDLKYLGRLSLAFTGVSDRDIEPLAQMKNIEILDLRGTAITERSLLVLDKMPHLREVTLGKCPNLRVNAIRKFARAHPHVGLLSENIDLQPSCFDL